MTKRNNSATVTLDDEGIRLDRWFKRNRKEIAFTIIAKLLRKGLIRINGKRAEISSKLDNGDIITYPLIEAREEIFEKSPNGKMKKAILDSVIFKDENIIVLNKPAGMAVQGGTNIKDCVDDLAEFLKFGYDQKPKLVHRIDKETSGLLILARKTNIAAKLAELFRSKEVTKNYIAILVGVPKPNAGTIKTEIESEDKKKKQFSISNYEVLDYAANEYCLCNLEPVTGRKHQLRVHAAHIETPILGDAKYSKRNPQININQKFMYLHAYKISFNLMGKKYSLKAQVPPHFKSAFKELGLTLSE